MKPRKESTEEKRKRLKKEFEEEAQNPKPTKFELALMELEDEYFADKTDLKRKFVWDKNNLWVEYIKKKSALDTDNTLNQGDKTNETTNRLRKE